MSKLSTLKPKVQTLDTRRGSTVATERIRGWELTKKRQRIALRDCYACQVCGRAVSLDGGEVDHIVPLHMGGADSDENSQWICKEPCHREKSEREEDERNN
jgi:5-methylcytosine-specific restriction enzyme A